MHHASDQPRILIGGTGRCGTSILATLFQLHPRVLYFPEPRVWMEGGGLLQVLRGEITLEHYRLCLIEKHRHRMIYWLTAHGHEGAEDVYSARNVSATLQWAFSQPGSRIEQAGRFVDGLFSLGLQRWGGCTWAEKTPKTVMHADLLGQMFPRMRYVHIFREPKDVYCSIRRKDWGPNTVTEFVHYYNGIMHRAWHAQRELDDIRYMALSLVQLVRNPARVARAVLTFTGLSQIDDVIERFAENVNAHDSHAGRWREELEPDAVHVIDRTCAPTYQRWLLKAEKSGLLQTVAPATSASSA